MSSNSLFSDFSDLRMVSESLMTIQDDEIHGEAQYILVMEWTRTNPHAAAEFAAKIQDIYWRRCAQQGVIRIVEMKKIIDKINNFYCDKQ